MTLTISILTRLSNIINQTCILRAWDLNKPVIVCPAMNTHMWNHPLTAMHIKTLTDILGYSVIPPISKKLACNDIG